MKKSICFAAIAGIAALFVSCNNVNSLLGGAKYPADQAETYAKGGEIFVLDMGTPVKIDVLARNLIKLCGFSPDIDIKIEYSGLRPGEKLYEEKLMAEEGLEMTPNKLIHIAKPLSWELPSFLSLLEKLVLASYENRNDVFDIVASIVPTFHHHEEPHVQETDQTRI